MMSSPADSSAGRKRRGNRRAAVPAALLSPFHAHRAHHARAADALLRRWALTGLPLLFSDKPWAGVLARLLGGFQAAGAIHRTCALSCGVFASHIVLVARRAIANRDLAGHTMGARFDGSAAAGRRRPL